MLKKDIPVLFQLGSSRSEFATASEHQQLGVVDVRASHGFFQLASSRHMSATVCANQGLTPLFALRPPAANRKR